MKRLLTVLAAATGLVSCTELQPFYAGQALSPEAGAGSIVHKTHAPETSGGCAGLHKNAGQQIVQELDSARIRVLTWNTHKHLQAGVHKDLAVLSAAADLVLLQETVIDEEHSDDLNNQKYLNFAPGYIRADQITGVMTGSRVAPVAGCQLASIEPWLRSPKATSITRYALRDRDDSLLVVNLHMINFTLGPAAMEAQLLAALAEVDSHTGPVIVSGDLNTWSQTRFDTADTLIRRRGLEPVVFANDERTRIFGRPVDHIYLRGLAAEDAYAIAVDSSDHNPLVATLVVL